MFSLEVDLNWFFNYTSPMDRFLIVMPKEGTMKRKKDVRRHALGANFAKAIAMK